MKTWIGVAIVTAALSFGSPALVGAKTLAATAAVQTANSSDATDFSAMRRYRRYYRYGYRPYYRPYYYARPYYYRPYPNYYAPAPVPFGFGFGFGPLWW